MIHSDSYASTVHRLLWNGYEGGEQQCPVWQELIGGQVCSIQQFLLQGCDVHFNQLTGHFCCFEDKMHRIPIVGTLRPIRNGHSASVGWQGWCQERHFAFLLLPKGVEMHCLGQSHCRLCDQSNPVFSANIEQREMIVCPFFAGVGTEDPLAEQFTAIQCSFHCHQSGIWNCSSWP